MVQNVIFDCYMQYEIHNSNRGKQDKNNQRPILRGRRDEGIRDRSPNGWRGNRRVLQR